MLKSPRMIMTELKRYKWMNERRDRDGNMG